MRYVQVRVIGQDGRPVAQASVNVHVYQFAAGGQKQGYTDSDGQVEIPLDVDDGAEISISINGREYYPRASIRGSYRVNL